MKAKHVGPTKIITWPCSTLKCCVGPWKGTASVRSQQEYAAQRRTWDPGVRCLSNKMVGQLFFKKLNYSLSSVGRGRGCCGTEGVGERQGEEWSVPREGNRWVAWGCPSEGTS